MQDSSSILAKHCIVRCAQRYDHGPHFGMDIAEDIGNALAIEANSAPRSGLIESKIESLALKERENIVEERVLVRKVDVAADGNYQQMRMEFLALLQKLIVMWLRVQCLLIRARRGRSLLDQPNGSLGRGRMTRRLIDLQMN